MDTLQRMLKQHEQQIGGLRSLMAQARAEGHPMDGLMWRVAAALLEGDLAARGLLVERIDPDTGQRRTWERRSPPNRKGQMGTARRCGARTRKGGACQCLPVPGKRRCRFHGGLSTGPKTTEGKARISAAVAAANRKRCGYGLLCVLSF